jgi:hypothetical protein
MYVCGMHVYIRIAMHTYTGIYVLDVHTNYVQTHCVCIYTYRRPATCIHISEDVSMYLGSV